MTERQISDKLREIEIARIRKFYDDQGFIVKRILAQNSPSSLILFTEDEEGNERYVEVKFVVKKPSYTPDEDIYAYEGELAARAEKHVRAQYNKLKKSEQKLVTETDLQNQIKAYIDSYDK